MARIFEVELMVYGPVSIKRAIAFSTEKELDMGNIFRSDISIRPDKQGFVITSTVYTVDQDRAYKVALLFIGKMLDILAIRINTPLNVSINEYRNIGGGNNVRSVINREEFIFCFTLARELNLHHNKLLRAFSWYRKGQYTEDPFDKFLAYWNAISVVSDGYCNDNERTKLGIINRIWDCFISLWGECSKWPHIHGDENWVNDNNEIRNKIAHGGVTVDVEYVENVISKLPNVQKVAYQFLSEWSNYVLRRNINEEF